MIAESTKISELKEQNVEAAIDVVAAILIDKVMIAQRADNELNYKRIS